MAVALFPKLREIDIHSNPLTTRRSGNPSWVFPFMRLFLKIECSMLKSPSCICLNAGDPPLLTRYLHDILGITIKRKKTREDVKLPLKVSTDPKWKVGCVLHSPFRIHSMKVKQFCQRLVFYFCNIFAVQVEERIPKVSVMLMDAPCPTQSEKSQLTAERTPESKSKKKRDDTLQENTEHFFVTQVQVCMVCVILMFLLSIWKYTCGGGIEVKYSDPPL